MKKHLLASAAMLLLASTAAIAADGTTQDSAMKPMATQAPNVSTAAAPSATPASANAESAEGETGGKHRSYTLEDARKHAHERADQLDKMTQAEWEQKQQKRHAWLDKWHSMTQEQKEAYKKDKAAKHHAKQDSSGSPAAIAPSAGANATTPADATANPTPASNAPASPRQ